MPYPATYDVVTAYRTIHQIILDFAQGLTDEQLRWKPAGYPTSIGFHLWHLAREADFLRAAILERIPLGPEFGEPLQIWDADKLAERWGFPIHLGETNMGTGIPDEVAAALPLPPKEELLDYLRRAYAAIEAFTEQLDQHYALRQSAPAELSPRVLRIRDNILVFFLHDARHLGMMECLKGLLTGFGSATEKRP